MTSIVPSIFSKTYIKEYFSRNKTLIIIATLLLIFSSLLGFIFSGVIKAYVIEILKEIILSVPPNPTVLEEAQYLFLNNIRANIIIMLGGFLFSTMSVLAVILNGMVIGFTYTLVTPLQFAVGILPHGIFELPAVILALVGAFKITIMEFNLINALFKHRLREELANSKTIMKDIVLTFILILILLIIAALIEAGITPVLLHMVS